MLQLTFWQFLHVVAQKILHVQLDALCCYDSEFLGGFFGSQISVNKDIARQRFCNILKVRAGVFDHIQSRLGSSALVFGYPSGISEMFLCSRHHVDVLEGKLFGLFGCGFRTFIEIIIWDLKAVAMVEFPGLACFRDGPDHVNEVCWSFD